MKFSVTCREKFHIQHICYEQWWKADTGNFVSANSCSSCCPGLFLRILPALCIGFNPALHLRPQIVLVMQSRRTSRKSHSPLNRRRLPTVPQAAEETPPVASPASSWVESAFFFFSNSFLFIFLKINAPPLSSSTSDHRPPAALHLFHTHPSPHLLFVHPQTFCFYPFFLLKLKKTVKSTLCIFAPPVFPKSAHPVVHRACWERHDV